MNELKQLIQFVNKQKLKNLEVLGKEYSKSQAKVHALYDLIHDNKVESDSEAAAILYSGSEKNANYKRLKSRLEEKLLDSLLLIDLGNDSNHDIIYKRQECLKKWMAIKILFSNGLRSSAITQCHKLLKKSMRYDFTEISRDICQFLVEHYGIVEQNFTKYSFYKEKTEYYRELRNAEEKANDYRNELATHMVVSKEFKPEVYELAVSYSELLEPYARKYKSMELYRAAYSIFILRYEYVKDYNKALVKCEEMVAFLLSQPYNTNVIVLGIYIRMMICHLNMKNFENGKEIWNKCLEFGFLESMKNSINNSIFLEIYFLLCMQTRQYQEGYKVLNMAFEKIVSKNIFSARLETWKIYEAYTEYFIRTGHIRVDGVSKIKRKFRISKFLNEVPTFSKDKRGANVSILIVQLLFLLESKEYYRVSERVEALRMYCHRYLKNNEHFRSNCFIKMLLLLPESKYHKTGFLRKSDKLLKKLKNHPLEDSLQSSELEIVPFENLWEILTKNLDNKIQNVKLVGNGNQ